MNNSINQTGVSLTTMLSDAAREIVNRSRSKAQMNRLVDIMSADMDMLNSIYETLGRSYCGQTALSEEKISELKAKARHMELRLNRAHSRYSQLENAHSVDECTEAFRQELRVRAEKVQKKAGDKARDISDRAKKTAETIADRAAESAATASPTVEKITKLLLSLREKRAHRDFSEDSAEQTSEAVAEKPVCDKDKKNCSDEEKPEKKSVEQILRELDEDGTDENVPAATQSEQQQIDMIIEAMVDNLGPEYDAPEYEKAIGDIVRSMDTPEKNEDEAEGEDAG